MPLHNTFFYHEKIRKEALDEVAQQYKELAEAYLAAVEKGAKEAGIACEVVYERNDSSYDVIIRIAEKKECDLIMMASHGVDSPEEGYRQGLRRYARQIRTDHGIYR